MTSPKKSKLRKKRTAKPNIRINKGRIQIRLAGYKGLQRISASELIKHIPLNKIRIAAKKLYKLQGKTISKRRKNQQKRQKSKSK